MEESKGGTFFMKQKGSGTVAAGYHSKQGVYLIRVGDIISRSTSKASKERDNYYYSE